MRIFEYKQDFWPLEHWDEEQLLRRIKTLSVGYGGCYVGVFVYRCKEGWKAHRPLERETSPVLTAEACLESVIAQAKAGGWLREAILDGSVCIKLRQMSNGWYWQLVRPNSHEKESCYRAFVTEEEAMQDAKRHCLEKGLTIC